MVDTENGHKEMQNILMLKLIRVMQSNPNSEGRIRKGTPKFNM